ncbi:olfactory receptor 4N2-like [Cynoglossus semilaevis]|uniref:Olfactory receptor 4N2-like n=1 Tax=Cynoglossus semilaevis TaxID=244447 RepID=A0A3P8V9T3_CYNSE|nr:olfactory receptor 4N2-like [Cynoglossus semilaevis]
MSPSANNTTAAQLYMGHLERALLSTLTSVPCGVFLFVNATMLFTLRSKAVFRDTSRYVLLFNLLVTDTVHIAVSQVLYLIASSHVLLTYPVCGVFNMLAKLTNEVSPLTLVAMSLERYVAVCFPFRHAALTGPRNTAAAILAVWLFSSMNILTRVLLLLDFPFQQLDSLWMTEFCSDFAMMVGPVSAQYDRAYTCSLFVLAAVSIFASYVGVATAARSASTDRESVARIRTTLLLHLVQLGLSLSSTVYLSVLVLLFTAYSRLMFIRLQNVLYVLIFIFPRCLSSLIYGIRDQTIRLALVQNLWCFKNSQNQRLRKNRVHHWFNNDLLS